MTYTMIELLEKLGKNFGMLHYVNGRHEAVSNYKSFKDRKVGIGNTEIEALESLAKFYEL